MAKVHISRGALVCENVSFQGKHAIEIGAGTVIHPLCVIDASNGPVLIGADNILEERCEIRNLGSGATMQVGSMNLFGVDSVVKARSIGHRNAIGIKARIELDAMVDDDCLIGAGVIVPASEQLPSRHVAFRVGEGKFFKRLQEGASKEHVKHHMMYLDALRDFTGRNCLLNFHQVLRSPG